MKEVNPNVFIESDKPEEISLGILSGEIQRKIKDNQNKKDYRN